MISRAVQNPVVRSKYDILIRRFPSETYYRGPDVSNFVNRVVISNFKFQGFKRQLSLTSR